MVIFIIFSIFAQIAIIFNIKWALDITFFYGPVSYLILGYFLSNVKISYNKHIIILLILFLISTLIKIKTGIFVYTQDFHTYLDLSFFQIIQVSTLFLIIKYVYDNKKLVIYKIMNNHYMKKYILSISKSSYGMYFVQHPLIFHIIRPAFDKLSLTGSQTLIGILIIILLVFFISWIVIVIMSKIPLLKYISGYK